MSLNLAFDGELLQDHIEFANDCISYILGLYKGTHSHTTHTLHTSPEQPPAHAHARTHTHTHTVPILPSGQPNAPRSVILVGHSMGGLIARAVLTLPNYKPQSVTFVF